MNKNTRTGFAEGKTIRFGRYRYSKSETIGTPIEWRVLDVRNGSALILSEYAMESACYYYTGYDPISENVRELTQRGLTWEECTLRKRLNTDFQEEAFTPEEREAILLSDVKNGRDEGMPGCETDGGNDTRDRVFLLSCREARQYLGALTEYVPELARLERNRLDLGFFFSGFNDFNDTVDPADIPGMNARCYYTPEGIAFWDKDDDPYVTAEIKPSFYWWLRSPAGGPFTASCVSGCGVITHAIANHPDMLVRPAMRIDIGAYFRTLI